MFGGEQVALNSPITRYPDADRVQVSMQRFLNLHTVFDLKDFLSGWFLDCPADSIPRGNLEEFVAYGFFCQRIEEMDGEGAAAVKSFVSKVEEKWNIHFEAGYDASLQFMAHVWEPLRVYHKPLAMYAMTVRFFDFFD